MPAPYSQDLRQRVIGFMALGGSARAAATRFDVSVSSAVQGGLNSGHAAEEKPATAAVTGPERVPLKSYTRQAFRTVWPLGSSVLEACILWRRSGLNLDRPLHQPQVGDVAQVAGPAELHQLDAARPAVCARFDQLQHQSHPRSPSRKRPGRSYRPLRTPPISRPSRLVAGASACKGEAW